MKIPLRYVKLRHPLDSVEPLNTTALATNRGWTLTLDTETGLIRGVLTRGEGEGKTERRVEFHASAAAHWEREVWPDPIDFTGMGHHQAAGALFDAMARPKLEVTFGQEQLKPQGEPHGRKPRAKGNRKTQPQPEEPGGTDPQP